MSLSALSYAPMPRNMKNINDAKRCRYHIACCGLYKAKVSAILFAACCRKQYEQYHAMGDLAAYILKHWLFKRVIII